MSRVPTAWEFTEATRHGDDKSEARFTRPTKECPHPERWTSQDVEATEDEVLDGLYGLVRLLQPEFILETGSHRGFGTEALALGLRENGHGSMVSVEIDYRLFEEAKKRVEGFPEVTMRLGDSMELEIDKPIDFAWFDSGPGDIRAREFARFFPMMHDSTIVGFHDVAPHHVEIRAAVRKLMKRGYCHGLFLPTPRGICLARVTK